MDPGSIPVQKPLKFTAYAPASSRTVSKRRYEMHDSRRTRTHTSNQSSKQYSLRRGSSQSILEGSEPAETNANN